MKQSDINGSSPALIPGLGTTGRGGAVPLGSWAGGLALLFVASFLLSSCVVGPKYQRPTAPAPAPDAYKESPPEGWKQAQPSDSTIRGKWWEVYNDPQLNALEEQVNISNQNVLAAIAQYREARDSVRIARSNYFPTASAGPTVTSIRESPTVVPTSTSTGSFSEYSMPVDVSYQADVFGSIRRTVAASYANAQVSAADLENARLTYTAQLAELYFELHGLDGDEDLLERTVKDYEDYLQLTRYRFNAGVASGADVAQAETQLTTTQTSLIDLGVLRAQYEHAIAILIGKPPANFSVPRLILKTPPPPVPIGLPSALLERRPDIAAAERQVAAANEQIGIAKAAFFPSLVISATAGFQTSSVGDWFTWPSRFWSAGPQVAETVFDAGKRRAQLDLQRAAYDSTVANYRQTVLTSFQQVEDNLAALRILEQEAAAANQAVKAAEDSLAISTAQYKAGTATYLQVITAQGFALQNERTAIDILARRLTSSVLLIEALGGGWDVSQLPSGAALRTP